MSSMIKVFSVENNELLLSVDSKFSVGRTENNTLFIPHQSISRAHAEILPLGAEWFIKDLGSTNGTFLNEKKIPAGKYHILRDDDQIRFGSISTSITNSSQKNRQKSLIVFQNNIYEGSFIINPSAFFNYGGHQSTISPFTENLKELVFVIKEDKDLLFVSPKSSLYPIYHNGQQINIITEIKDRDEVAIGTHSILISVPPEPSSVNFIKEKEEEEVAIPDYLKSRIGEDGWNDPLEIKRKNTQSRLLNAPVNHESEKLSESFSTAELGKNRFTRPSLETIKYQEIEKEKKYALMGVITLVILLGMISILFNLYFRVIF